MSNMINCTGIKISNLRRGLSRDQQHQEPSEQPEQPPDEADHGRGDGGDGHPGHIGHVGHGHPGRCQPPLISVAASLGFHHHCLLPTKQEISSSKTSHHGAKEPGVEGHGNEHKEVGEGEGDEVEEGLERVCPRK